MHYDGPIIDAHHHLWDLALGRHPWLNAAQDAIEALGDIAYMRRDYLIRDYMTDVGTEAVVGSVVIEAVWDKHRPVTEEVDWLESLPRPGAIASRFVAAASLRSPDLADALAELTRRSSVVGIRETIRWHPDPAKRWAEDGLLDDPAWRNGAEMLARHGLLLELLMNPYQAEALARLAADLPGQVFVVNHCCSPVDRDAEGLARWQAGLARMAERPNIVLKVSNFPTYAGARSSEAIRRVVMTCIDAFGPSRIMFGTDYPVARRTLGYGAICAAFRTAIDGLSADEQRAVCHDNAARLYRMELLTPARH